jgi:hypothetical protein
MKSIVGCCLVAIKYVIFIVKIVFSIFYSIGKGEQYRRWIRFLRVNRAEVGNYLGVFNHEDVQTSPTAQTKLCPCA